MITFIFKAASWNKSSFYSHWANFADVFGINKSAAICKITSSAQEFPVSQSLKNKLGFITAN